MFAFFANATLKEWLYAAAVIACIAVGVFLRGVWDEKSNERKVTEAINAERHSCDDNQSLTAKADHAYHDQSTPIDADLDDALHGLCDLAETAPEAAGKPDASTAKPRLPVVRKEDSWLIVTRAAACDKQAVQLKELQNFVRQAWKAHGQALK